EDVTEALRDKMSHNHELVREHVQWALGRLSKQE
ncbi:MAG: hypothetical protein RL563_395, partial [Pseudomonadota bacterium]